MEQIICIGAYSVLCLILRGLMFAIGIILFDNSSVGFTINLPKTQKYKESITPLYELIEDDSPFSFYRDKVTNAKIRGVLKINKWQQELTDSNWNVVGLFFIPLPVSFNSWQYCKQDSIPFKVGDVFVTKDNLSDYIGYTIDIPNIYEREYANILANRKNEQEEAEMKEFTLKNLAINKEFKVNKL